MHTDVLVIGSGIAGAVTALRLAEDKQRQITVLTREDDAIESSSRYAQGGIIGRSENDSPEKLVEDILRSGAGLSNLETVQMFAEEGSELLREILIEKAQVPFDRNPQGGIAYGLEGAHSLARILHVADTTGKAIMKSLLELILQYSNIQLLTNWSAIDLITYPHHSIDPLDIYQDPVCLGAYAFDQSNQRVEPITADFTVLATGGVGQLYLNTTNPVGARGDGVAMAYRAGAQIINAEYVQFHPTALAISGSSKFLISEAVRGEGAVLLTPDGEEFMTRYSPEWKDLAPRDIVARAIYWEMLTNDYEHVFLDISDHMAAKKIKERFPEIYRTCLSHGFDMTEGPIPVVPAAHYFCGGIKVDENGRSSLPGLYAIGEVSCTGLHGANRLASTSLLEGLVWGSRCAVEIRSRKKTQVERSHSVPEWSLAGLEFDPDPALIQSDMKTIRNLMWHYVGLLRKEYRLGRAERDLRYLRWEIESFYRKTRLSDELIGLRNAIQTALIITYAARKNRRSLGCHYREDYPQ